MKLHKILDKILNLNNLNKFLNSILTNYKIFNIISKKNYKLNRNDFEDGLYNDSEEDSNIIIMFKLLEKKFYKIIKSQISKTLNYKEEIKNNNSSKKFILIICDNKIKIDIFKVFLLFYYTNLKMLNNKAYIGLDFEFNTKVAALIQMNFSIIDNIFNENLIFIIEPEIFKNNWRVFFVEYILCNKNIYKILHGSDSLDIPYIYSTLLKSEINLILKFTRCLIDTKFLCEYSYYLNDFELGKCKIYYILLKEGIISDKKFYKLLKNENDMGPIYDITISINKMNDNLINYTLYDVVYLYELVNFYKKNLKDFDLINELARVSLLSKRNDYQIIPAEEINKINNYIFYKDNKAIKLLDNFNEKFKKFTEKYEVINTLLKVNYVKSLVVNIFKYEKYFSIAKNFTIFSKLKNKEEYDKKIMDFDKNYKLLNKFKKYITIFNQFKD